MILPISLAALCLGCLAGGIFLVIQGFAGFAFFVGILVGLLGMDAVVEARDINYRRAGVLTDGGWQ